MELDDRIDQFIEAEAFITVKDHKKNFPDRIQCRLLNPAKSNLGKISKTILEEAVKEIKSKTSYQQWQNTQDGISWFSSLENKKDLAEIIAQTTLPRQISTRYIRCIAN